MLQYKIAQNVEVEDKIVGPLTMKQLIICAVGGGIAYVIFLTLSSTYFIEVWLPPVAIISIITLMIAFLEIRGIKFTKWFLLMMEAMINPNKRVWDKDESTALIYEPPSAKQVAKEEEDDKKDDDKKDDQPKELMPQLDELTKALHMPTEKPTAPPPQSTASPAGDISPMADPNVIHKNAPVTPTLAQKPSGL